MSPLVLFRIANLSSPKAERAEIIDPPVVSRPPFKDKTAYRKWCADPATDHAFLSPVEGLSPHLRVSASNPPWKLHGLVGEYDATVPEDWETRHLSKGPFPPMWATRTFSGHGRVYWAFAVPVEISNPRLAEEFYKVAFTELKARKLGPGFELAESSKPTQYFEIGTDWVRVGGAPISEATLAAWVFKAAQRVDWAKEAPGIPIERVRAEAERRWPGRWPGGWDHFDVGVRGIRFWDDSADAESVLVTESGCVCWTGERSWMPWREIFGPDWVRRQSEDIIGTAISNLWCEPGAGRYWKKKEGGEKVQIPTRTDLILHLNVMGLSPKVPKGETLSEIERAIFTLQETRSVHGIHPAFYNPNDVVVISRKRYLNVSTVRPGIAAPGKHRWGEGFPWIAEFFKQSLREQLWHVMAWFAVSYRQALEGNPKPGLVLLLCGPASTGKTFTSTKLARYVFGDSEDASSFLLGEDQFNSTLMGCPLWTVDDAVAATDRKIHDRYSQLLKQISANASLKFRGMWREGYTAMWGGRAIVTFNDDPESLLMMPGWDRSITDKTMLAKVYPHNLKFPSDEELAAELPHFCAFLRDWEIPPEIAVGGRFGIAPYHHPELMAAAAEASDTMGPEQLILMWRERYFADHPEKDKWEGHTSALQQAIESYESIADLARRQIRSANVMARYLNKLLARGVKWLGRKHAHKNGQKILVITKPTADELE